MSKWFRQLVVTQPDLWTHWVPLIMFAVLALMFYEYANSF